MEQATIEKQQTVLVHSGEIGTIRCSGTIKTLPDTLCTVLTFYIKNPKLAIVAHIGTYTSVASVIDSIFTQLGPHLGLLDSSENFIITVYKNGPQSMSFRHFRELTSYLNAYGLPFTVTHLCYNQKPQIEMDASSGEVVNKNSDYSRELLQSARLTQNTHTDTCCEAVACSTGRMTLLQAAQLSNTEEAVASAARRTCSEGMQAVIANEEFLWKRLLGRIITQLRFPKIKEAWNAGDINLVMRLTAFLTECTPLLKFMLLHKELFGLNLRSHGPRSGTALENALEVRNHSGMSCLESAENHPLLAGEKEQAMFKLFEKIQALYDESDTVYDVCIGLFYSEQYKSLVSYAASREETVGVLQFLLKHKELFDIDLTDSSTQFQAAFMNHPANMAVIHKHGYTDMQLPYRNADLEIIHCVLEFDSMLLNQLVSNRDLSVLLRNAASDPKYLELLRKLLVHKDTLGIDIDAAGETSGKTALDVATEKGNHAAITLLTD